MNARQITDALKSQVGSTHHGDHEHDKGDTGASRNPALNLFHTLVRQFEGHLQRLTHALQASPICYRRLFHE
jgi:hypothetical protein